MKNKNSVELCELCGEKPNAARSVPTPFRINYQLSTKKNYQLNQKTMENKTLWSKILNIVITVLTAIATTFGVTSCIGI
jgi:ribosomal protein L28